MQEQAAEILKRNWNGGTRVTNCVAHMGQPIDKRPDECRLCLTDLRNHLDYCIAVNEWLNRWKDDAEKVLKTIVEHTP